MAQSETAMIFGIIIILLLSAFISINTYINIIPQETANIVLLVTIVIGLIGIGISLSDGVMTTTETGFIAGIGMALALLYNYDLLNASEMMTGVIFVMSLVFSVGAVYLLIKQIRE